MGVLKWLFKQLGLGLFFVILMLVVTLCFKKIPFILVLVLLIGTVILIRQDLLFSAPPPGST